MFDVGFAELFLLALIGLLVLGPERLPAVARTIGGFVNKARASWTSLRRTIESELAEADIVAPIKQAGEELKRIGEELPKVPSFSEQDLKSAALSSAGLDPEKDKDKKPESETADESPKTSTGEQSEVAEAEQAALDLPTENAETETDVSKTGRD